jgi:protein-L-isoaspartate(D-aspartate) O-methyltransferase
MEPMAFARFLQVASLRASDKVLDIGCGTGYSSAVLAKIVDSVVALECDEELATRARDLLAGQGAFNVTVVDGPLAEGCPGYGPYDVILINGRVPDIPQPIFRQLKPEGRLVAAVGEAAVVRTVLYTLSDGVIGGRAVFDASIAPLPGFPSPKPAFVF